MTEPLQPSEPPKRERFMGMDEPENTGARVKMAAGLLGGIAVSAVAWGLFMKTMTPALMAVIIGGKFALAFACLAMRRWRPMGQGLLASIAIGAMIFVFKVCSNLEG